MTLQLWHDFFLLTGTAAATLLGLVFVAASIAAVIPNEKLGDMSQGNIWVIPILTAFVRVLILCALGVMPGQTWRSFGCLVTLLAGLDLVNTVWRTRALHRFHRTKERLTPADWWWYAVAPAAATVAIAVTGVSFCMEGPVPMYVLAAGLLGHLVVGVHNAWELAIWLATRQ